MPTEDTFLFSVAINIIIIFIGFSILKNISEIKWSIELAKEAGKLGLEFEVDNKHDAIPKHKKFNLFSLGYKRTISNRIYACY